MMAPVIPLTPALQRFDWGSTQGIPELLGFVPDGEPYAEARWGAHPFAPSTTAVGPLDAVIAADPIEALGTDVVQTYGRLPYLLKVLSIARPLSIQVHPTLERARAGFAAEEDSGVPLSHPDRTYRDASHKPEMLVAVTEMTVAAGFRPENELMRDLEGLGGADAASLRESLASGGNAAYVTSVLTSDHSDAIARLATGEAGDGIAARSAADALAHHVGDPGALVLLAMNVVTLAPGEALFTSAGTVHCYLSGDGIEIMANSDNVVRAGLTHKRVDADLMRELAVLTPTAPVVPRVSSEGAAQRLSVDATEFELSVVRGGTATAPSGPRIVLSIEGDARLTTRSDAVDLGRGEAVFVAAGEGPVEIETSGVVVVASVPLPRG